MPSGTKKSGDKPPPVGGAAPQFYGQQPPVAQPVEVQPVLPIVPVVLAAGEQLGQHEEQQQGQQGPDAAQPIVVGQVEQPTPNTQQPTAQQSPQQTDVMQLADSSSPITVQQAGIAASSQPQVEPVEAQVEHRLQRKDKGKKPDKQESKHVAKDTGQVWIAEFSSIHPTFNSRSKLNSSDSQGDIFDLEVGVSPGDLEGEKLGALLDGLFTKFIFCRTEEIAKGTKFKISFLLAYGSLDAITRKAMSKVMGKEMTLEEAEAESSQIGKKWKEQLSRVQQYLNERSIRSIRIDGIDRKLSEFVSIEASLWDEAKAKLELYHKNLCDQVRKAISSGENKVGFDNAKDEDATKFADRLLKNNIPVKERRMDYMQARLHMKTNGSIPYLDEEVILIIAHRILLNGRGCFFYKSDPLECIKFAQDVAGKMNGICPWFRYKLDYKKPTGQNELTLILRELAHKEKEASETQGASSDTSGLSSSSSSSSFSPGHSPRGSTKSSSPIEIPDKSHDSDESSSSPTSSSPFGSSPPKAESPLSKSASPLQLTGEDDTKGVTRLRRASDSTKVLSQPLAVGSVTVSRSWKETSKLKQLSSHTTEDHRLPSPVGGQETGSEPTPQQLSPESPRKSPALKAPSAPESPKKQVSPLPSEHPSRPVSAGEQHKQGSKDEQTESLDKCIDDCIEAAKKVSDLCELKLKLKLAQMQQQQGTSKPLPQEFRSSVQSTKQPIGQNSSLLFSQPKLLDGTASSQRAIKAGSESVSPCPIKS